MNVRAQPTARRAFTPSWPIRAIRVGRKRVARLMEVAGIYGVSRRKWITTTTRDRAMRPAPDLVERNFSAPAPNELWVSDITYIPTWTGFLYLAVVLDVFSRRVVGWAMETHLRTELVLAALNMALGQRRPADVIHHSDQGTQYTSIAFGTRCQQAGVRPSMGSVGDCFDNAMAESFFATLECELLERRSFKTQAPRHPWRSLTSSRAGTILIVATPRSAISRRSITNATMELMPTNLEVRGRHAHRWAAEKPGGRRGAQRRGRKSKTFKLSGPLRSGEGWGRKAGLRPTLMRKVGGC